jgi:hypothetical protein
MRKIFAVSFVLLIHSLNAQIWSTLNDVDLGAFNQINTFELNNDQLLVGGIINELNGSAVTGILIWDSTSFSTFSSIPYAGPNDIVIVGDSIYSVGSFTEIGEIEGTGGIGLWNGLAWQSVGGGSELVTVSIKSCAYYNERLYIGGGFSQVGEIDVPFSFASWDGTSWYEEESVYGLDKGPMVMTIYNGELIGGGNFNQTTTGNQMFRVGRFDGAHWHDINGGVNGTVYDLFVDGEDLYVGGTSTLAQFGDVVIPNNLARFDGTTWHGVGEFEEIGNTILAITKYRGQIYVGGLMTINGIPWQSLAYFDGVHWHQVPGSEDMDERVRCLEVYKDELYIGGDFDHAGGLEVPGLVRYYLHPDSVQWGVPDAVEEQTIKTFQIFPNPADEQLNIVFDQPLQGDVLITDMSGKQCHREGIGNRIRITIPTAALPKGTLLVSQLLSGRLMHTEKVVVR